MAQLKITNSDRKIIDDFRINLVRENIDNNQKRKIIENLLHYERFTDIGDVNCSFSDLFKTKNDTYFVQNGHVVGIMVGSPNFESNLKNLPKNLGNLSKLSFLLIVGTQIEKIPSSIGKLKNLRFLEIYGNSNLYSLPDNITELSGLEELHLGYNNLSSLPETIGNLSNLKKIKLGFNRLSVLPESFKNLSLDYIEILENPLRSLANIKFEIDLSLNISEIRPSFDITITDLMEKGKDLLNYYGNDVGPHVGEYDRINISEEILDSEGDSMEAREMITAFDYYNKSPTQLAQQYSEDSNSLTDNEKGRLAWEGSIREREILELDGSKIPPTDPILFEINKRLSMKNKMYL